MPGRLLQQYQTLSLKQRTMEHGPSRTPQDTEIITQTEEVKQNSVQSLLPPLPSPSNGEERRSSQPPLAIPHDLHESIQKLPPELHRVTEGYQPLSKLFIRSAQNCFNSLNNLISDLQTSSRPSQVNGVDAGHDDRESLDKRRRWLHFVKDNRDDFMALHVLLQWGTKSREPIGKLVDVVDWMRRRQMTDDDVQGALGLIRRDVSETKIPNPDLKTALGILSTGKSSRYQHPEYAPSPSLVPEKLLADLHNINTILHIRLNLHEDLPTHLRRFRIHSGRVTFMIEREFELDLSVVDEDPTSRFYFVDFRFLFTPCSEIPPGQLRFQLETSANAVLANQGLSACFDFLHDFILTYKLSVLRRQALELARNAWSGSLRVERIHRSTIINYWADRPARKSWLEIGIHSGRQPVSAGLAHKGISKLHVKWVCNGKDMSQEESIEMDEELLDLESLLENVVARHIRRLFQHCAESLMTTLPAAIGPAVHLSSTDESAQSCSLTVPMYSSEQATLYIEPTTGRFSINPVDSTSARTEEIFNDLKNPMDELVARMISWRERDAVVTFQRAARQFGWDIVGRLNLDATERRRLFGDADAAPSFIRKWQTPQWVVAALPDGESGFRVWLFEVALADPSVYESVGPQIASFKTLQPEGNMLSFTYFLQMERTCLGVISSTTLHRHLRELHLPFILGKFLFGTALFPPVLVEPPFLERETSISRKLALSYRKLSSMREGSSVPSPQVLLMAVGHIEPGPSLSTLVSSISSEDIKFRANGTFAVASRSSVDSVDVINDVLGKVAQIARVNGLLKSLHRLDLNITEISLGSLSFLYANTPQTLCAKLRWSLSEPESLEFSPLDNPHRRLHNLIVPFMKSDLARSVSRLSSLPQFLSATLPLLIAFDTIEAKRSVKVYTMDLSSFSVVYARPRCTIKVQFKNSKGQCWWSIVQEFPRNIPHVPHQPSLNQKLLDELGKFFAGTSTEDCVRLRVGMAAKIHTVGRVILDLDEIIRPCADDEPRLPVHSEVTPAQPLLDLRKMQGVGLGTSQTRRPSFEAQHLGLSQQSQSIQGHPIDGPPSQANRGHHAQQSQNLAKIQAAHEMQNRQQSSSGQINGASHAGQSQAQVKIQAQNREQAQRQIQQQQGHGQRHTVQPNQKQHRTDERHQNQNSGSKPNESKKPQPETIVLD